MPENANYYEKIIQSKKLALQIECYVLKYKKEQVNKFIAKSKLITTFDFVN